MAKKKANKVTKPPAKKSTKTKSGSSASGKNKHENRTSTASVSADLKLPKEPNPQTPMSVDQEPKKEEMKEVMSFAFETELNLWFLCKLAHKADETTMQGNDRFCRIADACADQWTEAPKFFDNATDIKKEPMTVEKGMGYIHDLVQKNNVYLAVVCGSGPATTIYILQIHEAVADKDSRVRNFWNLSNSENPILDSECLVVNFWAATSFILGHPWRTNYHFLRLQGEQNVLDVPNASKGSGDLHQDAITNWLNLSSPLVSSSLWSHSPATVNSQSSNPELGAGPPIWVAVGSILILMMELAAFGFECLTALSTSLVTAQCFSFVDDTEAIGAADDVYQILRAIQLAALLCSGGIRATGSAINPYITDTLIN